MQINTMQMLMPNTCVVSSNSPVLIDGILWLQLLVCYYRLSTHSKLVRSTLGIHRAHIL